MIHKIKLYISICMLALGVSVLQAQQATDCDPLASLPVSQGEININYGSVTNAFSFRNRSSFTVAQPFIASSVGKEFTMQTGFWTRFLLPPKAPQVTATQGEFPDRVLIDWNLDPLSSEPVEGYVVTRDGAFLSQVDRKVTQFIDFNVQAGEIYDYGVYGRNQFGNGSEGRSLGFVSPNGVITGLVTTPNRNPVPGAIVRLEPIVGTAMAFNGTNSHLCISHKSVVPNEMWTVSAWVKIGATHDSDGIIDFGSDIDKNYWIHTTPSGMGKGVVIGTGDGNQRYEITHEFGTNPDGWHQVTAVYAAGNLLLYIDGRYVTSRNAAIAQEDALITVGARRNLSGYLDGKIDDVRLYNRPLTSTEILTTKDIGVSKKTNGLIAYLAFNEGIGRRSFDITDNAMHAYIFGATYTNDHSQVQNGSITDETGFYAIEGINYSQVENFTAIPSKTFYKSYALETNAAYNAYAELTDFDLTDSSTIEVIIQPYDKVSRQSILSKGSKFELWISANNLFLTVNGEDQVLGPITTDYQHIALSIDASSDQVKYYRDGNLITTLSYASLGGEWTGGKWLLAAKGSSPSDFYTGLIDEVAFYKDILPLSTVQLNASKLPAGGTNIGHPDLVHYFDLNDGKGTFIEDTGLGNLGDGIAYNASFSVITYKEESEQHLFRPSERLVNINSSNTAASGIDFTNESLVGISGVVRFDETFCYQDSVEILVNGSRFFPPIYTNIDGRFVAEFEPGSSVTLTPKFGKEDMEHQFYPPFYKVRNLNRPIAGVLFANLTKRTIDGQFSGGDSRLSVIYIDEMDPSGSDLVRVKIEAANQCFEQELTLDEVNGKFVFRNLPPIVMDVKVTLHTDPTIYNYMQVQGGQTKDMRNKMRDTVDFRYYAPPQVWMEPFEETVCSNGASTPFPTIEESSPLNGFKLYKKTLRMYEDYTGGRDWLENFDLIVTNNLNDEEPKSFEVRDTSAFKYDFYVGQANITGDFSKFLQVEGISLRNENHVEVQRAIVLGEREREASFVTRSPEIPILILRDPPGDGSSATWEKGQTHCQTWSGMFMTSGFYTNEQEISLGGTVTTSVGVGAETELEIEVEETATTTATLTVGLEAGAAGEMCVTTTKTITTSDGDAIIGEEADLYVGAAVNFKFAANDVLWLNTNTCAISSDSLTISVEPSGFATEFIYSEHQINTSVIPNLELTGDLVSADAWRNIISYNEQLKNKSKFRKNLSFDGLANYTETFETSSTNSFDLTTSLEFSAEQALALGASANDIGVSNTVTLGFTIGGSFSAGGSSSENTLVSFTLADDDPNDSYTVDVLDDAVFGTPVFRTRAGESLCPWIPGTLNREEVGFQIDAVTAVDVSENEAAVFRVKLSNLGQTGRESGLYMMGVVPGSNPDGAGVSIDTDPVLLGPGETKEFLVSVEIGPDGDVYSYNDIGIFAASVCQFEHAQAQPPYDISAYANWEKNNPGVTRPTKAQNVRVGPYNIADLEKFYKQFNLSVEFQEPCSPIDIGFPFQDWVQTPNLGDNLTISLNSFNNEDSDLELIRVQWRRTGGDGAWVNIVDIPKAELTNPISKNITWDMSDLADGPYEIRAVTQCFSGLPPGISAVIKGRKETKPPVIFGKPQPSDGVLSPGDEISITFSKRVNCIQIFPADGIGTNINLNNMALQDVTLGGVLIDADFVCKDDKIIIIPKINKRFIENHVLRVTATGIKDLYGNLIPAPIVWEFYVNQSNLYWHGGDIDEVVLEGNELMVRREIRNQSGEITSFLIEGYPEWMQIFPTAGALEPGQILPVNFVFPADLVANAYSTTVQMQTIDGDEPMKVDLRVACPSPEWSIDPSQYSFSMNLTLQLDIEGEIADDKLDKVGAFVDGQLRGLGYVQYSRSLDRHLVFLTVYSNIPAGETVTFQIWDASACLLFASTIETFPYVADGLIGSPLTPQVIHTNNQVLRKIYIHPGWNWLSYNIDLTDPTTNNALSLLTNPAGGLIKSQTAFSTYSIGAGSWLGDLTDLTHLTMYQYNSLAYDSLILIGAPVDPTTQIPLVAGWNWIGYLPQYGLPVTKALASLDPVNGDIIKGQISFAQYVAGVGWVGNLNFLNTPNGYLIKMANADILTYPGLEDESNVIGDQTEGRSIKPLGFAENKLTDIDTKLSEIAAASHWNVTPQNFEFSMNVIAIVVNENTNNLLKDGDEVAAFVGNEVRGVGKAMYVAALDSYFLFMTMYANKEGELVTFKYYSNQEAKEYDIIQQKGFTINEIWGKVETPVELTLSTTVSTTEENLSKDDHLVIYPNPAGYYVYINFTSMIDEEISLTITDLLGAEVKSFDYKVQQGQNVIEWKPVASLPNGLYLVTLKTQKGSYSRLAELLR
jgi:Concanavalin A-like lectin/glucanases superfamily/Secretion system C-terminal sorting domain